MTIDAEWLETDGLGGFASATAGGLRTRRYHGLLLAATTPPSGRVMLVNGCDAWLEGSHGRDALTRQRYVRDVTAPADAARLTGFSYQPWPRWTYRLGDGTEVTHEVIVGHGAPIVALRWTLDQPDTRTLVVRPFLSARDPHALHHENPAFDFAAKVTERRVVWRPYAAWPAIISWANAVYHHEPLWYRNFQYDDERARGLDWYEDLAAPGTLRFDMSSGEALWVLAADLPEADARLAGVDPTAFAQRLIERERQRRSRFPSSLHRAAADYIVEGGSTRTIIAGYPWFGSWGRDTFIAMRGLCLATGWLDDARRILLDWAGRVSEGMLPNYLTERGGEPAFNSVDASLWFIVAVGALLESTASLNRRLPRAEEKALTDAVQEILRGYSRGTRYGIHADADALLAAGEPGTQLTWMDALFAGRPVTPRWGKPVEVQALWVNALVIGSVTSAEWSDMATRATEAFRARFWNVKRGCLYDVVDVEGRAGVVDDALRPNQLFAVGGLPRPLIDGERARSVVDVAERTLWTPMGPRSLAPGEPGYVGHYGGGLAARDGAYHMGTIWPWLAATFVDAWLRVYGNDTANRRVARDRFLSQLLGHTEEAGLGHVSELADGDAPHDPRGCPFQAWSVGELIRLIGSLADSPPQQDNDPRPS